MEAKDNIIENFIFDYILRREINHKILLDLIDFILSQKIDNKDKQDIISLIIWNKLVDTNIEITEIISNYREWKKIPKLYELLLNFINDKVNIDDNLSLNLIQNQSKFELENVIQNISFKIIDFVCEKIKKEIKSKKSIFEVVSNDYMDEKEKQDLLSFIQNISYEFDKEDLENISKVNELIKNNLDKANKIYNIK